MGLDSYEFPLRNYGDLPFRLFGSVARHVTNVIQVIQLIAILGQVIILNGQGVSTVPFENLLPPLPPSFNLLNTNLAYTVPDSRHVSPGLSPVCYN